MAKSLDIIHQLVGGKIKRFEGKDWYIYPLSLGLLLALLFGEAYENL